MTFLSILKSPAGNPVTLKVKNQDLAIERLPVDGLLDPTEPMKNSDTDKNRVTRVTRVTAQADNPEKVTQVTQPKPPGLPEKTNDLALVTEVIEVTQEFINPQLFSGLESIPARAPDDGDFWDWHGAFDLRDIAAQYGMAVRRSVRGSVLVVYPAPLNPQLVEYCADCLKDCRGYLAKFPGIPTIHPAEALAEFRRMGGEVQHIPGGFVPVYPGAWPGYVKEAAHGLFLAAVNEIEAEDLAEVEAARKKYTQSKGK